MKALLFRLLTAALICCSISHASEGEEYSTSFSARIMDDSSRGPASLLACDIDADGDLDILGAVLEDSDVAYWQNDGGIPARWTKKIIDGNFIYAISVYAADIEGDGDLDVVGAGAGQNEISVWINDGRVPIGWTKQVIRKDFNFAHEVYAHDLDLDGDVDLLGASTALNRISWWENRGGNPVDWVEQTVDSSFIEAKSVRAADIDLDGDVDIVGAALKGNEVSWWSNGGGTPVVWKKFPVDTAFLGAHRVQAVDIDGDDDIDILGAAYLGDAIVWWENVRGDPVGWKKHVIDGNFPRACIACAIDLDNDGDLDVAGSAQDGNEIAWWRNDARDGVTEWTKCRVDSLFRAWPLDCADVDRDGDIDIIAASGWKGINTVVLYENQVVSGKAAK